MSTTQHNTQCDDTVDIHIRTSREVGTLIARLMQEFGWRLEDAPHILLLHGLEVYQDQEPQLFEGFEGAIERAEHLLHAGAIGA